MSKKQMSLTKQSQILVLGQALSFCFNFLVPIVVVRYFDVAQYGVYKQIFLIVMTFLLILPFGSIESLFYFIPRDRDQKIYYVTQTFWLLILASIIFLTLLFSTGKYFLGLLKFAHLYMYSVPLGLYIALMFISLPFERVLLIEGHVKSSSVVTVISEIGKGVCIVASTVLTRDIAIMLYALVAFASIRMAAFVYYIVRFQLLSLSRSAISLDRLKLFLNYSLPFGMSVAVATLRRYLHQYFVSFLFTIQDFAIYAAGSFQLPLMKLTYKTVSNVILIKISESQKQRKYGEILEIWLNSARKLALVYFPITFFFIVASKEFITIIFTERYLESVPIFIVTVLQLPWNVFITQSVLKAFAETRYLFRLNSVFLVITIVLVYVFIQMLGMIGASVATLMSLSLLRISEVVKVKRLVDAPLKRLIPWRIFLNIAAVCLFCPILTIFLKSVVSFTRPLQTFLMEAALFTLLYIVAIFSSGLLLKSEKEEIKRMINKLSPVTF